jgi:pimeloyl-ACP methyl ester carboxylesterase
MRRLLLALLVVLAVLLAVNTIVMDNETKEAKAEGGGQVLDLPGDDLHVQEDGSAGRPAIVMLHGFAGSLNWWTPVAERLAEEFRVIRIDLLGHGGSAKPKDGYSMESQARRVAQAMAELDVQHGVIAGHSMGGAVATALTQLDPSLVDGLALLGSSANEDAGELPFLARLGFVPVIGEAIRRVVPDGVVEDNLEDAFAPGFDVPNQFVDDFNRMTYSSYDGSHHGSDDYNEERAVADRLAALRKPLLVLQGAEDEIVDPDSAQDFRRVRGADVVLMPGVGHSPMVEKPDQTARLIERFARRVQRGPAGQTPEGGGSARG